MEPLDNSQNEHEQPESPKEQAEEIFINIKQQPAPDNARRTVQGLLEFFSNSIDEVDQEEARQRVRVLRATWPDLSLDDLVGQLIKTKCQQTAAIGATTTGAALIPGVGTLASLTVGVAADIGATFKLQAELVLEIAEAHQHELNEQEKRHIVLLVTGMSAGGNQLVSRTGSRVSLKISERYARKWLSHALPVIGVAASAATNALSTYVIGQRAHAYFGRDEAAMGNWLDNLRAISGVDERAIREWTTDMGQRSWSRLSSGAWLASRGVAGVGSAAAGKLGDTADAAREGIANAAAHAGARLADTGDTLGEAATSTRHAAAATVSSAICKVRTGAASLAHRASRVLPGQRK